MAVQKHYAGTQLRELRGRLGLTQKLFAERLGVSLPYLNQMENNNRPVSTTVVLALAQEFGFDVTELGQGDSERLVTDMREALADPIFAEAPPLARVEDVRVEDLGAAPDGRPQDFTIVESTDSEAGPLTMVPPDTAPCDACVAELADPADRRFRHPFIACTHCGPRLTITRDLPYDRPATTMAAFPLCDACATTVAVGLTLWSGWEFYRDVWKQRHQPRG